MCAREWPLCALSDTRKRVEQIFVSVLPFDDDDDDDVDVDVDESPASERARARETQKAVARCASCNMAPLEFRQRLLCARILLNATSAERIYRYIGFARALASFERKPRMLRVCGAKNCAQRCARVAASHLGARCHNGRARATRSRRVNDMQMTPARAFARRAHFRSQGGRKSRALRNKATRAVSAVCRPACATAGMSFSGLDLGACARATMHNAPNVMEPRTWTTRARVLCVYRARTGTRVVCLAAAAAAAAVANERLVSGATFLLRARQQQQINSRAAPTRQRPKSCTAATIKSSLRARARVCLCSCKLKFMRARARARVVNTLTSCCCTYVRLGALWRRAPPLCHC